MRHATMAVHRPGLFCVRRGRDDDCIFVLLLDVLCVVDAPQHNQRRETCVVRRTPSPRCRWRIKGFDSEATEMGWGNRTSA